MRRMAKNSSAPEGCEGLEIKTETSICTGEKMIGFYDPVGRKLLKAELVTSDDDINVFRKKYGVIQ